MPPAVNSKSKSHNSRRATGSMPAVGSSRKSTVGLCINEQAIASRCRIPPESNPARLSMSRSRCVIAITHLERDIDKRAGLLSGGMRQRLAMACSLMHKPTVLFLDEPTAGIDPVARLELWDLLFEFTAGGMTLFVTTHYMDEAERCDHVGYIYMSKLIVCGEPDELKQMPDVNPPGTRRLDVTCDHVTTALRAMRELRGVRSATVFGQSMHLLVDENIRRAEIDEKLSSVGISHSEIHEIGPSLEDVFVTLSAKYAAEEQKEKAA